MKVPKRAIYVTITFIKNERRGIFQVSKLLGNKCAEQHAYINFQGVDLLGNRIKCNQGRSLGKSSCWQSLGNVSLKVFRGSGFQWTDRYSSSVESLESTDKAVLYKTVQYQHLWGSEWCSPSKNITFNLVDLHSHHFILPRIVNWGLHISTYLQNSPCRVLPF